MKGSAPIPLNLTDLFSAHQVELVRHLSKIVRCDETAADLAQESYLILSKTARQETIEHPRGFLYRVAVNLALNHLRHHKIAEAKAHYLQADDDTPSAEHLAEQRQRLDRFTQIVEELPPKCRDVFILHKVRGMSLKEVAAELDISVKMVEKHITVGLKHTRERLLEWDES